MMEMCIQCGQHPRFSRRGKTYNLCAVCGWRALCKVLKLPDDASKTPDQKVAEAVDYVPFEEWAAGGAARKERRMKAKNIDLDTDFSHYSDRHRLACEQLQTKARELLTQDAKRYEDRHPDVLLNAAAEALAPDPPRGPARLVGGQDRYSGIFACEGCGQLYYTDYSINSDPHHDYCGGDTCQPERSHRKYD